MFKTTISTRVVCFPTGLRDVCCNLNFMAFQLIPSNILGVPEYLPIYVTLSLMKDRQWLAIIVGLFGVYLLVHAAVAGYGLYSANEALRPPVPNDGPFVPELREVYPALIATFSVFATLSALSMTACMGFVRNYNWARPLWLVTSAMVVVSIAVAVIFLRTVWTHYLFELLAICLSCWYVWRLPKGAR